MVASGKTFRVLGSLALLILCSCSLLGQEMPAAALAHPELDAVTRAIG
jgi:hypothetical protein